MDLRLQLVLGLCLVTVVVMLGAAVHSVAASYHTAQLEVRATLDRAAFMIARTYRTEDNVHAARMALEVVPVMAPGTCIEYQAVGVSRRMQCAGWQGFGPIPPAWFRHALKQVLGPIATVDKEGRNARGAHYDVEASFDVVAAATRAWQQVRRTVAQAIAMAIGIVGLGTLLLLYSLRPVPRIVDALGRLAAGELDTRLKPDGAREFRRIGQAVNDLAGELERAAAMRTALTRKLLEVEDVERRQLARDLHDEFGQTLTATGALAMSIETGAGDPGLAADARAIARNVRRMMDTLRGAFARLRPPDLDEVGLEASLRAMFAAWSASCGGTPRFRFRSAAGLPAVPPHIALDIYRIAQECVTNAVRHGSPTLVSAELGPAYGGADYVLSVEDDGGGSADAIADGAGHGILGIRERVSAMGGRFAAEGTGAGVRIVVTIPAIAARAA